MRARKAAGGCRLFTRANALGRFIGTLLSGLLYQWGGLLYGLVGSAVMLACAGAHLALPCTGHPRRRAEQAPLSGCRAAGSRS